MSTTTAGMLHCGFPELLGANCKPNSSRSLKKQWSSKKHREPDEEEPEREWPVDPIQYELLEKAGKGAHAVVYRGRCKANDEIVAVKCMDLDCNWDLTALIREATLMKKYHHPAVLPLHAAFVAGKELWLVTPLMGLGSVRGIMKQHFPLGLDEMVIATIMRPVLQALEYVHKNNGIHRDVKADNILLGESGDVVLADFGVAAARMRAVSMVNMDVAAVMATTFVGTPCWMAPEVMQQEEGYNTSADIWSFGITLIELATGRPPMARMHPMRVLMDTMNKPAPQLPDSPTGPQFSRALKEAVEACCQKDPTQRPSASALLNLRFFKMARDADFLKEHFLCGLIPSPAKNINNNSPGMAQQQRAAAAAANTQAAADNTPGASGFIAAATAMGAAAHLPGISACKPPGLQRSQQQQQQQPLQNGARMAAAAAGLGGGCSFVSAPSSSGPSRLASGWYFPSALHSYRMESPLEVEGDEEAAVAAEADAERGAAAGAAGATAAAEKQFPQELRNQAVSQGAQQTMHYHLQQQQPLTKQESHSASFVSGPSMGSGCHRPSAMLGGYQLESHFEVKGDKEEAAVANAGGTPPGDNGTQTDVNGKSGSVLLFGQLDSNRHSNDSSYSSSGKAISGPFPLAIGMQLMLQPGSQAAAAAASAAEDYFAEARGSLSSKSSHGSDSDASSDDWQDCLALSAACERLPGSGFSGATEAETAAATLTTTAAGDMSFSVSVSRKPNWLDDLTVAGGGLEVGTSSAAGDDDYADPHVASPRLAICSDYSTCCSSSSNSSCDGSNAAEQLQPEAISGTIQAAEAACMVTVVSNAPNNYGAGSEESGALDATESSSAEAVAVVVPDNPGTGILQQTDKPQQQQEHQCLQQQQQEQAQDQQQQSIQHARVEQSPQGQRKVPSPIKAASKLGLSLLCDLKALVLRSPKGPNSGSTATSPAAAEKALPATPTTQRARVLCWHAL